MYDSVHAAVLQCAYRYTEFCITIMLHALIRSRLMVCMEMWLILITFRFFTAVKFGRMSKKQREKVEDEVRYHKEISNQQSGLTAPGGGRTHTASGSSPDTTGTVFDPQQPSSTDHIFPNYNTEYNPNGYPNFASAALPQPPHNAAAAAAAGSNNGGSGGNGGDPGWSSGGDYSVDSTTSPFEPRHNSTDTLNPLNAGGNPSTSSSSGDHPANNAPANPQEQTSVSISTGETTFHSTYFYGCVE